MNKLKSKRKKTEKIRGKSKQNGPFMTNDQSVPGAGAQRIDVDTRAGSGRSQNEPSVRRPPPFFGVTKQIVLEKFRHNRKKDNEKNSTEKLKEKAQPLASTLNSFYQLSYVVSCCNR
uniref:Uncharacterized protein n=1 Tax=Romanomermis culicivorax TaxID=13658 RepID=A0A915LD52_ROMCU